MQLELEPHEQLDEIDLRTNDDGTVQVKVLGWEKKEYGDPVVVTFRKPTGEKVHEGMVWPEANDPSYKFIRFIGATPYTLRTAEEINSDDDIWLDAQNSNREWRLVLPKEKPLIKRVKEFAGDDIGWLTLKLLLWPVTIVSIMLAEIQHEVSYTSIHGSEYDNSPFVDSEDRAHDLTVFKYSMITVCWIIMFEIGIALL